MAVHYPKALIRETKHAGLRLVTIDCGAGIRFQGGVTSQQQMDLIKLVELFSRQQVEAAYGHSASPHMPPDRLETRTIPGMEPPSQNGTHPPIPEPADPPKSPPPSPKPPSKRKAGRKAR